MKTKHIASLICIAAYALFPVACSAPQQAQLAAFNAKVEAFLGSPQVKGVESAILPLVASYAATGHISEAQAIPAAFNAIASAASIKPGTTNAQLLAAVQTGVLTYTGSTSSANTGQKLAQALVAAVNPGIPAAQIDPNATPTAPPAQIVATAIQAGVAASNAANGGA